MAKTEIRKWELIDSREVFSSEPWIRVYVDRVRLPGGKIVDDYYRIDLPEYAMIYALGRDGKVLLERIYKHAIGEISFVLPTGCIEKDEQPVETAKRELLEETGYRANKWTYIGSFVVDGNKGSGKGYFFIAEDIEKVDEPQNDEMEEAEIVFWEPELAMEYVLKSRTAELATAALLALATNPHAVRLRDRGELSK
jgi:ADP-ribose pyrophosphatase